MSERSYLTSPVCFCPAGISSPLVQFTKIRLMKVCCGNTFKFNMQACVASKGQSESCFNYIHSRIWGKLHVVNTHPSDRLKGTGAGRCCCTYYRHVAGHTYQHSCPRGLVKIHPCSVALTHSRTILLYSDKRNSLYNYEFLSHIHRYLLIRSKHQTVTS